MSTISHPPTGAAPARGRWLLDLPREMWTSLAITAMWVAVAISAVWGTDFVSSTTGGSTTTIPLGMFVALFACIGSWAAAKHGFAARDRDAG